jgi:hypothetical protein
MNAAAPAHSRVVLGSLATLSAFALMALGSSAAAQSATPTLRTPATDSAAAKKNARAAYAKLPLAFVPNAGQTDARVRYSAQAGGASFYFTQKEAVFSFAGKRQGLALRLAFIGANPDVAIGARKRGAGKVNYLIGSDPAKWRTNLPTYGQVVYHDLWPGIDMVFRGANGQLKYEFLVRPGARVSDIRLAYRGTGGLSLGRGGTLKIQTPLGVMTDTAPRSYQLAGGERVAVASSYALQGRRGYGFALGPGYNPTRPLVIDPGLVYSTFVGGSGSDQGFGIAVDATGAAYVTGLTVSTNFPTPAGAFDMSFNGVIDAFVTKLNPLGTGLVYSTYLGGSNDDRGFGIAADALGSAYVTGNTRSANFPTTAGAFDTTHNGDDAFVTKLNALGTALVYSTFLGGGSAGNGIALDASGAAYVTGFTSAGGVPTTPGAFDTTHNGSSDAFVTKLNSLGTALVYSTFLGGTVSDQGWGIALDASGAAYVTGLTNSTDFPTTLGAFDTTHNGSSDAFVTKLNPLGTAPLVYSTFLGESANDQGLGIAVDALSAAHVTGVTSSTNFPTTVGAFDTTYNGGVNDAFVTKLNSLGTGLVYSSFLGGSGTDVGFGIALASGAAHVTGQTSSTNFPTTAGAFDTTYNGGADDAFVTKLNSLGTGLDYSTFLGGNSSETSRGIALDPVGNAYVTGLTNSANFPTTVGAFDRSVSFFDVFVTKLDLIPAFVPATLTLDPLAGTNTVGTSHTVTATVRDAGGQPVPNVIVRFTVTGSVNTTGQCTTGPGGTCTFTYPGPPLPGADAITAYADTDGDNTQDLGEPAGAATKAWVLPASTEFCEVKITQGGWIIAMNGDRASFGGNARVEEDGTVNTVKGQENYQDHGPVSPRHVQSIELTAMTCSDDLDEGTIFGRATVDGSGNFMFRIDVTDEGQDDTYGIIMSDGYASGQQQLGGGNVQIHKN